jgi:ketosteroid isomerase-like protein
MKRVALIVGVLTIFVAGVAAQQKSGADEAAIAKIRAAYQTAGIAQDGAALAKLYATDGEEMPPNAPAVKGRAAIEKYHKDYAT